MRFKPLPAVAAVALPMIACAQSTIHVDDDASPGGTGLSWSSAFRYLQDALRYASTHPAVREIRVAGGTYRPDRDEGGFVTPGDRNASFVLRSGLAIRGGFRGIGAPDPDARDVVAFRSTLSGDLAGNDGPNWANHTENSIHVVAAAWTDTTAILDGFTITAGYDGPSYGAGINLAHSRAQIVNCVVRDNLAYFGAGMVALESSCTIANTRFEGNLSWSGRGGGLYIQASIPQRVSVNHCAFIRNRAQEARAVADGGGIFSTGGCDLTVFGTLFQDNESWSQEPQFANGGAICSIADNLRLIGCTFLRNRALIGGGVWAARNVTVLNCVFSGNSSLYGGGMTSFLATVNVVNSVFSKNTADDGGGIANSNGNVHVRNSVFWGNTAVNAPGLFKAQVHNSQGTTDFRYSCVQGILTPIPGEDPPDPANFPGCFETDPLFVDADGPDNVAGTLDDDLHLTPASPCIDAGENAALPWGEFADLANGPRFVDEPSAPNVGLGVPPLTDIGAFEFSSAAQPVISRVSHFWEEEGLFGSAETFPAWYSDDLRVEAVADDFDPINQLRLRFHLRAASGSTLTAVIETSATRLGISETLEAWDAQARTWVVVTGRNADRSDSTLTVSLPGPASRYIEPSTGEVELRFRWAPFLDVEAADGWGIRLDRAWLRLDP